MLHRDVHVNTPDALDRTALLTCWNSRALLAASGASIVNSDVSLRRETVSALPGGERERCHGRQSMRRGGARAHLRSKPAVKSFLLSLASTTALTSVSSLASSNALPRACQVAVSSALIGALASEMTRTPGYLVELVDCIAELLMSALEPRARYSIAPHTSSSASEGHWRSTERRTELASMAGGARLIAQATTRQLVRPRPAAPSLSAWVLAPTSHPVQLRARVHALLGLQARAPAQQYLRSTRQSQLRGFRPSTPRRDVLFVSMPMLKHALLWVTKAALIALPLAWRWRLFKRFPKAARRGLLHLPLLALCLVLALGIHQSPVTARYKLLLMSEREEIEWARARFDEVVRDEGALVLPSSDPRVKLVRRVASRLIQSLHDHAPVSCVQFPRDDMIERLNARPAPSRPQLPASATIEAISMPWTVPSSNPEKRMPSHKWDVYLIDLPKINAFVMPSSQIVVCVPPSSAVTTALTGTRAGTRACSTSLATTRTCLQPSWRTRSAM